MQLTANRRSSGHIKRLCVILQSDLDLAFSYLRLAEAEIQGGKAAHATELMVKAIITHRTVLREFVNIPDFYETRRELAREARRLLESIQSVERQLHSAELQRC
jgi:hypothetical protein